MSNEPGEQIAEYYEELDALVKTLAFPAIYVAVTCASGDSQLKLSDKGLFDGGSFSFVELFPQKVNSLVAVPKGRKQRA